MAGGGERLARETTRSLDPDRFDRTLCVTRGGAPERLDPSEERARVDLEEVGVKVLRLRRDSRQKVWGWGPLLRELREQPVDVLHAHMFGSNVWAALLGTLARTPVIVAHEHTWSFEGRPLRRLLDRELIARRSDAFIAVSTEDRRRMIEIERIPPDDVIFIPNGIPTPPEPKGNDVRAELGIDPDAPLIGSVGVLRAQKRYDVLLHALVELRPRLPGVRAVIVGGGEGEAGLLELIDRLDLGETVILAGHREDVPDVLAALDVAVNCSDFEGSPLAIMEYMEAGLAIAATRVGGVPDLIEDGVNGLLIEPGRPQALAAAIEELLGDPERSAEMGRISRRRRREDFSLATMTRRLENLYEELLAKSGRR